MLDKLTDKFAFGGMVAHWIVLPFHELVLSSSFSTVLYSISSSASFRPTMVPYMAGVKWLTKARVIIAAIGIS